ncbi:MAG: aldo/keto reductase, partial [Terriglobales bacterium]
RDEWVEEPEWQEAVQKLKQQGKIKGFGVSIIDHQSESALKLARSGLADTVQVIYNIFDQAPEDALFPLCRELDTAVIARVPFDEGTLTGTLTRESEWPRGDWRNTYFVPENLKASVEHAEALRPLLPHGMSMPEMALRFILSNPEVSTVIPGMRKTRHVEANLAVSDQGPLEPDLLQRLRTHRWDRQPTLWSQ